MRFPPRWFSFLFATSDKEARGITVLSILIVIMIGVRITISNSNEAPPLDISITVLDSLSEKLHKKNEAQILSLTDFQKPKGPFDPNKQTKLGWIQLGLDSVIASRIEKYLNKGGRFFNNEDIKKIYGLPEWFYDSVSPYLLVQRTIQIQPDLEKATIPDRPKVLDTQNHLTDLNLADSIGLILVKGIGPVFASRILRYRERIGGYISKSQLLEVYGIDSSAFVGIIGQVSIDTSVFQIHKIKINSVDFNTLLRNPYLDYEQVKAILNFRKQHSGIRKKNFLEFPFLSERMKYRLLPYLDFSQPV